MPMTRSSSGAVSSTGAREPNIPDVRPDEKPCTKGCDGVEGLRIDVERLGKGKVGPTDHRF